MHEPMHQSDVHPLVGDRIHDLTRHPTSSARAARPQRSTTRPAWSTRTRRTIGLRLISIGSAVAGHQASGTQAARRHAA